MRRFGSMLLASLVLCGTGARAQSVSGTYAAEGSQGTVVLLLRQEPGGTVTGTLTGNGTQFAVQGRIDPEDPWTAAGIITGSNVGLYFEATVNGNALVLTLVEPDANQAPNYATARQMAFSRAASTAAAAAPTGKPTRPAGPSGGNPNATGAPGAQAGGGDSQLARLLLSSAWCSFGYSGSNTYGGSYGRTTSSRAVFRQDGILVMTDASETNASNPAGTAGIAGSGGQMLYWRVDGSLLYLSQDRNTWSPVQLQVSQNSNGYPIITADGTEYMMCN